ncbi:MAG: phosphoribosylglycinamide formyltransferase [Dehalococcoidia bacterium]
MTLRLGWFTTARGPGSRGMFEAVIAAREAGQLPDVEFSFVFCNRDPSEDPVTDSFLERAAGLGIPVVTKSSIHYRRAVGGERSRAGEPLPAWRLDYDREVERLLQPFPFDLGVLAGYMLIFEREFSLRHPLLNLHPALPGGPIGTWREVIRELIRTRASESGIMLHLAVPEVDAGPVVSFCRYPIRGSAFAGVWDGLPDDPAPLSNDALDATDLFAAIRSAGVRRESPLLVATLRAFADGRRFVSNGALLDAQGVPAAPADLTAEVEVIVAQSVASSPPGR